MKKHKVLILAYDFFPYVSVGGLRPYSWYKHLHESGVYPIIITRQWVNKYGNFLDYISPGYSTDNIIEKSECGTIIRTPYSPNLSNKLLLKYGKSKFKFLRLILNAFYELMQWIFFTGSKSQIYFAAKDYLKLNKADVIVATGDPFILFKYASKLSKLFKIPWIADYRDPWSNDVSIQNKYLHKIWNYILEKIISSNAEILTSTDFVKTQILSVVKNKTVQVLNNGYDSEITENLAEIKQNTKQLTISYAGTIYNYHPIRPFLTAISEFKNNNWGFQLQLNFYGINNESAIKEMIEYDFPGLQSMISFHPKMQNKLLLHELCKSNLLLLFNDYLNLGTKIYNYIAIKRTILFCFSDDAEAKRLKNKYCNLKEVKDISNHPQEDLICETNSGFIVKDSNHLYELLRQLYDEFIKTGHIQCNTSNYEKYSRKYQTQKLAEIIKTMTGK